MKKILVMTMAMLAMVFSFSSCGGSDDDDHNGGGSSANEVHRVYLFDNGNTDLNRQYKLTVGAETKVLKVDELKKVTVMPQDVEIKSASELNKAKGKTPINIYVYDIPATMHGAATLHSDYSIKDGIELPEKVTTLIGGYICVGGEGNLTAHGAVMYMGGMEKDIVKDYLERRNSASFGSCVLK